MPRGFQKQMYTMFRLYHLVPPRKYQNNPVVLESRGKPSKVTPQDLYAVEELLKEHGQFARTMTWDQLAHEALDTGISGHSL